jgi:hypothetical protein
VLSCHWGRCVSQGLQSFPKRTKVWKTLLSSPGNRWMLKAPLAKILRTSKEQNIQINLSRILSIMPRQLPVTLGKPQLCGYVVMRWHYHLRSWETTNTESIYNTLATCTLNCAAEGYHITQMLDTPSIQFKNFTVLICIACIAVACATAILANLTWSSICRAGLQAIPSIVVVCSNFPLGSPWQGQDSGPTLSLSVHVSQEKTLRTIMQYLWR